MVLGFKVSLTVFCSILLFLKELEMDYQASFLTDKYLLKLFREFPQEIKTEHELLLSIY
jgi:hypothetical protein